MSDSFHSLTENLAHSPLFAAALAAVIVALSGSLLRGGFPRAGRILSTAGNLALVAVVVMATLQVARLSNPALDLALPQVGMPEQRVAGEETVIPLAEDGHYWIEAMVGGAPRRFLVDTGATVTAISEDLATDAGIEASPGRMPVRLRTASGTLMARMATIPELRFGNVVARDMDAVIAPGTEGLNVLGMNFLSRLKSWRVEDGELILVPHHPQDARS